MALRFLFNCLILFSASVSLAAPAEYRIGVILPLTGDAASLGEAARNGMLLAYDNLPNSDRSRIRLIFEDDSFRTAKSATAFKKLLDADRINALLCWSSGTCRVVAPLAEAQHIPTIAIASDREVSRGRRYVVNFWMTPETESRRLLDEARRRGYRSVALVSSIWDGAIACRDAFLNESKGDPRVVFQEEVPPENQDFRTIVSRIAAAKDADAVLAILSPGQQASFAKQLRQGGSKAEIFGYTTLEDESDLKNSSGALEGAWFTTAAAPADTFAVAYRKRFPGASMVSSSNCHDAVLLFAAASKDGASADQAARFLRTVRDFSGACGTYSATGDNSFTLPATLKHVKDGRFDYLR